MQTEKLENGVHALSLSKFWLTRESLEVPQFAIEHKHLEENRRIATTYANFSKTFLILFEDYSERVFIFYQLVNFFWVSGDHWPCIVYFC